MRRFLLLLGALVVAGVALVAMSFTAQSLPLAPLPPFPAPVARGPDGMSLAAIRAGTMVSSAMFAYRGGARTDERKFNMGAIYVHHPRGDLLFDTGFGRNVDQHVQGAPFLMRAITKYDKGVSVADQLVAAHIEQKSLMGVVLTHAHWDHVSGLDDLRGVPVMLPQKELDFIHSGDLATELVRGFGDLNYRVFGFPSGPYLGFEESYDVFGDGSVVLVAAGGHTPGSVIAFVTLPAGRRYALVGDIVWQREGVELPAERPWASRKIADKDEARVRTIVVRLHMLAERFPDMVIVPAHDMRVWDTLPQLAH
ncbi:MAG TPA: MBL fold metallo-hydrolase [Polyangiaceae bacterium]|jgi:glyoxylase-like metal-dependent hydrolase (beta-lactamase superfamily II)|nr:MBL fold metallo-hydrolase [Polyangiaceae bacterium]